MLPPDLTSDFGECALIVAHPGHELRVHGWMQLAQPTVHVLTDGSGRSGKTRIGSTQRIIERVGGRIGAVFGRFADSQIYNAVLEKNTALFVELASELADELVNEQTRVVVGDVADGAILMHDICRYVIDAAIHMARVRTGNKIENLGFTVTDSTCAGGDIAARIELHDPYFKRKLNTAKSYQEIAHEVDAFIEAYGEDVLKVELLYRMNPGCRPIESHSVHSPPAYERHGRQLVDSGIYSQVLRFEEHVLPILEALSGWVDCYQVSAQQPCVS